MWVTAGVAVVVAAAVVILAAFLEGEPRPAPRRTGAVTAQELRSVELPTSWRGYDRGHVDALLARAALTIEEVRRYGPEVHDDAVMSSRRAAAPPSFLAVALPTDTGSTPDVTEPETGDEPSGEELEDRSSDGPGGLDG